MPTRKKLDDYIDSAILPGIEGDFEVLEAHSPFLTKLRPGILKTFKGTDTQIFAMHDGFVTVENDKILILSETCELKDEIDLKRAQRAKERAEKRLAELNTADTDYRRAEIALKRAISRINTHSAL
jgi:F-type H+-transporting ATPase subunit epsilon